MFDLVEIKDNTKNKESHNNSKKLKVSLTIPDVQKPNERKTYS